MTPSSPNAGETPSFRLLIFQGESIRTVPLIGDEWIIGRAEDCDITLRDQTVSRRHLRLERRDQEFHFHDLGGINPLLLNGKPARHGILAPDQTLLIGLTRISLDRRIARLAVVTDLGQTQIVGREVLDDELAARNSQGPLPPDEVTRLLESLEWPLADLGSLQEVAEPLLDLALKLTGRRRGALGRILANGSFECLATMDHSDQPREMRIPEQLLREARATNQSFLVTAHHRGTLFERMVVPLGPGPDGVLVLEDARREAPKGQEVLRLSRALASVVWQRILDTEQRLQLRDELAQLRFLGTTAHATILASARLQPLRPAVREAATQDITVLLLGEDGTEREELANYLHAQSSRTKGPFVPFFPSSIPDHRLAGELFGSGQGLGGALARSHGGTLYLDHPEHLPDWVQDRLAIALRDRRLDHDQDVPLDVRLVAGSDFQSPEAAADLQPMLARLLGGCRFRLPPLREDPRDVLTLAEVILSEMGPLPEGRPRTLSEGAKRLLAAWPWPGNLRELRSVLESAAGRAGSQPIQPRHLPEPLQSGTAPELKSVPTLEEVERQHVIAVLARVGQNRQRAAQALGIATSTLFEKIKRWGLDTARGRKDGDGPAPATPPAP